MTARLPGVEEAIGDRRTILQPTTTVDGNYLPETELWPSQSRNTEGFLTLKHPKFSRSKALNETLHSTKGLQNHSTHLVPERGADITDGEGLHTTVSGPPRILSMKYMSLVGLRHLKPLYQDGLFGPRIPTINAINGLFKGLRGIV